MFRWVGLAGFITIFILIVSILTTILCTKQIDCQLAEYRLDTAKKRNEAATVELDNALYKQWVYSILYKDVERKDDWQKVLEDFKRENGYYEGDEK